MMRRCVTHWGSGMDFKFDAAGRANAATVPGELTVKGARETDNPPAGERGDGTKKADTHASHTPRNTHRFKRDDTGYHGPSKTEQNRIEKNRK